MHYIANRYALSYYTLPRVSITRDSTVPHFRRCLMYAVHQPRVHISQHGDRSMYYILSHTPPPLSQTHHHENIQENHLKSQKAQ